MAKEEKKEVAEVKETYILKANLGSKPNGEPKKKAGDKVKLTKDEATNYKQQNLI